MAPETNPFVAEIRRAITQRVEQLATAYADVFSRYENASAAGAALAAEVYRFRLDPESVGLEALDKAYSAFMGQHSASFTDSARQATVDAE